MQTFALASAQVFALALSAYFQLMVMLMILVVGFAILAFFQPFEAPLSQNTQVCRDACHSLKCSNGFCTNHTVLLWFMSLIQVQQWFLCIALARTPHALNAMHVCIVITACVIPGSGYTSCVHGTSVVVVTAACLCFSEGCQA